MSNEEQSTQGKPAEEDYGQDEALDLTNHQNQKMEEGGIPEFKTLTEAVIVKAEWTQKNKEQDDAFGNKYLPGKLNITYGAEVNGKPKEWGEGFSGLYIYPDRLYCGPKSALGRLKKLMLDSNMTWDDLPQMATKLVGWKVQIKTEYTTVKGNEYKKNMPQSFISNEGIIPEEVV